MEKATSPPRLPVRPPRVGPSILAATLSLNLLALALPLVVLQIFDRVIPFQATETLFFLFLGLCVVAVLEFILKWCRAILLGGKAEQFEAKLCEVFVDATLNADPEEFRKTTPATHLDRFGAISQLRSHYGGQARILSIDLPFTAIFVVMIALIGGWLVAVPIVSLCLLLMFKTALTRAQSRVFDKRKVLDGRRYSFLAEVLSQIRTLKANTMEPQMQRRYELLQDQTAEISHDVIQFSGFSQSFGALFSQLAVAGMGLFGGYLVITQSIGIAELAACMLLNGRTVQPMLKALSLWAQSESLAMARAKVSEACAISSRAVTDQTPAEMAGHIRFEALGLKHPERDEFLFENIEGEIPAGGCLALRGNSGSGKSALLKLLLAEIEPTKGRVLIDGHAAPQFVEARGVGGIVYCDQTPVVLSGTVLENISAFGDGEMIETALGYSERMGLEKILHRLPMGHNTPVHENRALMNNQTFLQAMTIVRALALRPRILLLYNVSAGLDEAGISRLRSILSDLKGQTTMFLADADETLNQLADMHIDLAPGTAALADMWAQDAATDHAASHNPTSEKKAG